MSVADPWERIRINSHFRFQTRFERYGFTVLAVAVATVLSFGLRHLALFHASFLLFYPAIVLVALWCGFGPAVLATALAATSGGYFFLEPTSSFLVRTPEDVIVPALFAIIGVLLAFLTHSRTEARQALRVSENELNRAQSVAHIGSWHYDIEPGGLRVSDETCRILGLQQTSVSLCQAWEIVHPDDRDRVNDAWTAALGCGEYDEESRVLIAGQTRWVRVQARIERDAGGSATKAVGTIQDITDRKLAADRLQEYEKAMEGLTEMILVVDRDYRYVIANQAFLHGRGLARDQVIGRSLQEVVGSDVFDSLVKPKLDVCFDGKVVNFEKRFRYPALGERDFAVSYFPIGGPGAVERVAVVMQDVTEQKKANESLRLFRTLVDHSNDAVEVVDPETLRFLDINERACKDLGYTREELLGMTVFDINPEVNESMRAQVLETLRKEGFLLRQGIHQRKDGSIFPVETSLRLVQLDRSYVVAISRDITERKRAEEALGESEDRYRDLVEHSEDLVCTHDLEGRLLSVNAAPARILGYTPEELLKIPMRDLIIPEGRAEFDAYLDRLKNGSKVETGLLCVTTRNGEWRTWEYRNTLRTEGVPAPIVRGMAHDITERRRAELALMESEIRYRSLFEKSVAGVALIAMDGQVMHCNDAWARMFGQEDAKDCLGENVAQCCPDPAERTRLLETLKQYETYFNNELEMKRSDGSRLSLLVSSALASDDHGVPMIQTTAIDITARKQAEESLRASEERLWLAQEVACIGTFDRNLATGESRWTPQMEMMYGLKPGAFPRTMDEFIELVHQEDRARIRELVKTSLEKGEAQGEWRVQWPDSTVHWITGRWQVFKDIRGNPVRAIGIDYDITERKRAEQALRTSEERFRVALKGSPTAVFSQDRDLRYTWMHNFATLTPAQVLGKTDDEILGAEEARRMRELKENVLTTGQGVREEIAVSYNGAKFAYDLTLEPLLDSQSNVVGITGAAIDIARLREMADRLEEQRDKLVQEKSYLEGEIEAELGFEQIIGQSPALREVLRKARIVAPTDSTVLLLGETGTGKELVARALHALSGRHQKSFIKLNCAAVPSGLLESELFGHEKGAFTGAVNQKLGRLELADGGTLFLDEVGELPLDLQPKLLRVLQDREFERLGGVRTLHSDVRIISATNCDLERDVSERNFREDLFYRLNVFPISLPPLRERRSDIPVLVRYFVKKYAARMRRPIDVIPSETMRVLQNWNWPGNVRELENMIERMVILSKGSVLAAPPVELRLPQENSEDNLVEMERDYILRVLHETHGVLSGVDGAATRLGLKRTTLQSMLKRLGIDPNEYRRGNGTYGRD